MFLSFEFVSSFEFRDSNLPVLENWIKRYEIVKNLILPIQGDEFMRRGARAKGKKDVRQTINPEF